jgi:sigma-B regulation protein RsbU (phosphoserine phosphatase)
MSMQLSYSELRRRLSAAGLWPDGRMAHIACYLLALAVGLFAVQNLFRLVAPAWGAHLGGWVDFLTFIAGILFSILAFRWLKRRILWRLRNRLIVTYVFIGVIPVVLLVTLAFVTLYLFAGQFSGFVVTSELNSQMRSVEAANAAILNELAARLEHGDKPSVESLAGLRKRDREWGRREVCAWYGAKVVPLCSGTLGATSFPYPDFFNKGENPYAKELRDNQSFREIVRDHGQLYLRVASALPLRTETLTVVTSEPLDKDLVAKFAHNLGEITLYAAGIRSESGIGSSENVDATQKDAGTQSVVIVRPEPGKAALAPPQGQGSVSLQGDQLELRPTFSVGSLPPASGTLDREIQFGTPLRVVDWKTGESERAGALVRVRTLPSVLYGHLFASLGDFAKGVEYILLGVGIFFAIIEGVALFTGTRMTRTVTAAVAQLYDATKHVDRGDFSHRIPVKSADQLAQLSLSFNSMTESIEKLIQEQKEKQRLENELAIAQEVQAQLFPRQVSELESLEVHGFCRPARTVSGDYYDFLTASSHKLILAVGDISGKGISAALLMATIHSAVRAYSVENLPQMREPVAVGAVAGSGRVMATWPQGVEVSPGALLSLLNHQLYESTPPEKYATLFLGIYDGRSHRLTYSNGGHLPPILISDDGTIRRLESGGTVVGLFDNMTYEEGSVEMQPSEIFVAYSDGVTEPENDFGEFGEQRLIDLVRENRHLPLAQISQSVTMAVDDWIGDMEQPDDVTLVLARAR